MVFEMRSFNPNQKDKLINAAVRDLSSIELILGLWVVSMKLLITLFD